MRLPSIRRFIFVASVALYLVIVSRPPVHALSDPASATTPAGPINEQTLHELQGLTERLMKCGK